MTERSRRGRVARAAIVALRGLVRALPAGVRARLEDRFFDAVGHATRVTDDGYPQPSEAIPRRPR
jgi:hypothetical protein